MIISQKKEKYYDTMKVYIINKIIGKQLRTKSQLNWNILENEKNKYESIIKTKNVPIPWSVVRWRTVKCFNCS